MRRLALVCLLSSTAVAAPAPAKKPSGPNPVQNERLKKTAATLEQMGMGSGATFEWKRLGKNVLGDAKDAHIRLDSHKLQNRADLINTVAHEGKHVRDNRIRDQYHAQLDHEYDVRMKEAEKIGKKKTATEADNARHEQLMNEIDTLFRQRDAVNAWDDSRAKEPRAFRAGSYAQGRLGRPLNANFADNLPDKKEYANRKHLLASTINGFLVGSKHALLKSDGYERLAPKERMAARRRANIYLSGYNEFLLEQSKELMKKKPNYEYLAPGLRDRVDGRKAQRDQRDLTDEQLYEAGKDDAWRNLAPHGRFDELLGHPAPPTLKSRVGGLVARVKGWFGY